MSFVDQAVCDFATQHHLTVAEQREVRLMLAGMSSKESGAYQKISPETVRQRRKDIYLKCDRHYVGKVVAAVMRLDMPNDPS